LVTPVKPFKTETCYQPEMHNSTRTKILPKEGTGPGQSSPSARRIKNACSLPGIIWELGEYDVLCGRGAPTSYHSGNAFLRQIVLEYQTVYLCSKRSDKPAIAWKLLDMITSRGGRFVRRNKAHKGTTNFAWECLTDKQAYEKICQALREGAPEFRRRVFRVMQGTRDRGMEVLQEDHSKNNEDSGKDGEDSRMNDDDKTETIIKEVSWR
jgi:hypothetical protein